MPLSFVPSRAKACEGYPRITSGDDAFFFSDAFVVSTYGDVSALFIPLPNVSTHVGIGTVSGTISAEGSCVFRPLLSH